jgi:pimeloyl-ACP methyl ester carboxylesterase
MVAQAYAAKYPAAVKRLILVSTLFCGEQWQADIERCNSEIKDRFPAQWAKLRQLHASGVRSSAEEYRQILYRLPLNVLCFCDPRHATGVHIGLNFDVYDAIAGEDADVVRLEGIC